MKSVKNSNTNFELAESDEKLHTVLTAQTDTSKISHWGECTDEAYQAEVTLDLEKKEIDCEIGKSIYIDINPENK